MHMYMTCGFYAIAGKRFFEVDDERGILYYFRTRQAAEWEEPARHFQLSTLLCASLLPGPSQASHGAYVVPLRGRSSARGEFP